jgi:hypothetical protein
MTSEEELAVMTRLAQEQRAQIRRLVNLLLNLLDEKPESRERANHYIFIETTLYEYIEVEDHGT